MDCYYDGIDIIDYAIESSVKLIVFVGNIPLTKEYEEKLRNAKINVICTPFTSFKVVRLITLANEIKSIKRQENAICLDRLDYLTDFIDISNQTQKKKLLFFLNLLRNVKSNLKILIKYIK